MTRPRARRRLTPGMTVWVWYAGAPSRATLERRGWVALHKHWRMTIYANGQTHYAARRHVWLNYEDCANAR